MNSDLVVVRAFNGFPVGTRVTGQDQIERVLMSGHARDVVRVVVASDVTIEKKGV